MHENGTFSQHMRYLLSYGKTILKMHGFPRSYYGNAITYVYLTFLLYHVANKCEPFPTDKHSIFSRSEINCGVVTV